ncbi:MAG: SurA N-terminal domain-containing protein [Alphaproteobacteria bacterium]|nr:SurA N-terminal domain-containing protein [Alphaproteobacteria bacterium]
MLEYLRNASEKPIAKILITILAFSFVGWGVAEWIFGNVTGDSALVYVGDTDVSAQRFNAEKSRELAQMTREQQRAVYTDAATQNAFLQRVMTKLTTQQMAENRADDLGFVVSDHRIAREIRDFPEFQVNGEFSTFAFDTVLSNSGYSEAEFADVLRGQVLRSMVLGSMSVPLKVPEFAITAAYNARYAQRDIKYATVKYSDFKVAEPTDEQLRAFYEQNPQIIPEMRTVSYVMVPADMSKPDDYDAAYAIALKVEDAIIAGEPLSTAASANKAKYVSLKPFAHDNRPVDKVLTDTIVAKIFDMASGEDSELLETKDGFVIFHIDEIKPSHKAEFETVKKSLISDWKHAEQKKQAYVRANEILVTLNQDNKMDGKTATVSRASGAPVDVLVATFRDKVGENSIVPGSDAFYVLHIDREIAPKLDTKKMTDLRKELQNMSATNIMDDYNAFLIREYPIKINEKVFNRFFVK